MAILDAAPAAASGLTDRSDSRHGRGGTFSRAELTGAKVTFIPSESQTRRGPPPQGEVHRQRSHLHRGEGGRSVSGRRSLDLLSSSTNKHDSVAVRVSKLQDSSATPWLRAMMKDADLGGVCRSLVKICLLKHNC